MPLDATLGSLALNAKEVACRFSISTQHWMDLVREGRAPSAVKLGKSTRWLVADIEEWAALRCPPVNDQHHRLRHSTHHRKRGRQ